MSSAMSAVEQMKEGACQEEQVREDAQHVGSVLRDDEEGPDPEKGEQHDPRARPEPGTSFR